jgi:hypothetical protein
MCNGKDDASTILNISPQTVTIKKRMPLQLWYAEQASVYFTVWFSLTADVFNTW